MMDAYTILAEAISSKQQVVARYHDEERIFSPHALGSKRGASHVLVYQYAGGSQSGLPSGGEWRCLNVANPLPPRATARPSPAGHRPAP
jgi:hypothetical protein